MTTLTLEQLRFNMIEQQIRPWDVLDPLVLDLLKHVRREEFVPPQHRALAFVDMEIPLRGEHEDALRLGQIMLNPKVEARLLQEVALRPHEKALEVGTGSGYMAALLAGRAQRVVSLEIEPELVRMARDNLQRAGVRNVDVREADGAQGLAAEGPFDAIVLSGSVAQVPPALLQQLKVGGRLATIVGEEPVMRATLITRTGDTTFTTVQRWDTVAPRLVNFPEPFAVPLLTMIDQVRPTDLDAWLASHGGNGVVLDVREPPELSAAFVQARGFELVAIPMNEVPQRLAELDPQRPVACLCHHGTRSQRVAMYLAQNGYAQVANISGGIDAWSRERDPTVARY